MTCAEPTCGRPMGSRGPRAMYCRSHQQQMRRWGFVKPLFDFMPAKGLTCAVDTCDRPVDAKGFCKKHWKRYWKHGDPETVRSAWDELDPFRRVCYYAAHDRVKYHLGPAKGNRCIDCGTRAGHWAYDGTDPTELISERAGSAGCRYSLYPEFYMPMCVSCHRLHDLAVAADGSYISRQWELRSGSGNLVRS